jgi:hypothetical protein
VYQKIIPRSLSYDFEIVYERLFKAYQTIKCSLSLTYCLILISGHQSLAAHALWLVLELAMESAMIVNYGDEQDV